MIEEKTTEEMLNDLVEVEKSGKMKPEALAFRGGVLLPGLKAARESQGVSQSDLVSVLHINRSNLQHYEHLRRKCSLPSRIVDLSRCLGASPLEIIDTASLKDFYYRVVGNNGSESKTPIKQSNPSKIVEVPEWESPAKENVPDELSKDFRISSLEEQVENLSRRLEALENKKSGFWKLFS